MLKGARENKAAVSSPGASRLVLAPQQEGNSREEAKKHHLLRPGHELRLLNNPSPIDLEPQLGTQPLLQGRPRYVVGVRRRLAQGRPDVADAARHGLQQRRRPLRRARLVARDVVADGRHMLFLLFFGGLGPSALFSSQSSELTY